MRLLFFALFITFALPSMAATPEATISDPVVRSIQMLAPGAPITSLTHGPFPGVVTAVVDGQPIYVSDDGRYVLQGHLYDMRTGLDITGRYAAKKRAKVLARLDPKGLIVFAPDHPRYRVIAFVDPTCSFCQQLVSHMSGYLAQGIEVDVAAWPRDGTAPGLPAYQRAVDVWCAPNRAAALKGIFTSQAPIPRHCDNPVTAQARIANALALPGTPGLLAPDGTLLGGFVMPHDLRASLDRLASQHENASQ